MNLVPLEIVIPIYNEGEKVIKLLNLFKINVKTKFRVLLCYDSEKDDIFQFSEEIKKFNFETILVKNPLSGPCAAVKEGLGYGNAECKIVFPADDFLNIRLIDEMFFLFKKGNDVVVPSRFMPGGSMIGCPIIKELLVRSASLILYFFSNIGVRDATNGFRLFSGRLLKSVKIESEKGFAYSLELLAKAKRLGYKSCELPAQWEEREIKSKSRFKIMYWLPEYLKWFFFCLSTNWLRKKI